MKYLKTYEQNNLDLKQYCCVRYVDEETKDVDYYIDEILSVTGKIVKYSIIYEYDIQNDEFKFIEPKDQLESNSFINHYKETLIETYDNLEECFKKIRLTVSTDQYNL